jgi:hypothetical protein
LITDVHPNKPAVVFADNAFLVGSVIDSFNKTVGSGNLEELYNKGLAHICKVITESQEISDADFTEIAD